MARKKIIAGNWKMNTTLKDGVKLAKDITKKAKLGKNVSVIFGVPATHLHAVKMGIGRSTKISVAAQNFHAKDGGAFTGEISANMLKGISVKHVILGHSERREIFGEDDKMIAAKVTQAIENKITPIFCCGEPLKIRKSKKYVAYVGAQLKKGLFHLSAKDFAKVVIAYEPIWAIGTGMTASPEQAQEIHKKIRTMITKKYNAKLADNTTILYGGSVKPVNAADLFSQPDVDGGLVGGASLKSKDFLAIIHSMK